MKQTHLPEISSFDHFLGMYHDGSCFRVVKWNDTFESDSFYCYSDKYDKIEYKTIISDYCLIDDRSLMAGVIFWFLENSQIHVIYNNKDLILCGSDFNVYSLDFSEFYINLGGNSLSVVKDFTDLVDGEKFTWFSSEQAELNYKNSLFGGFTTLPFDNEEFKIIMCDGRFCCLSNGQIVRYNKSKPTTAKKFAYSSDYICYYNASTIYVYENQGGILVRVKKINNKDTIVDVKYSPDGKILLVISKSKIYLYDGETYQLLKTMIVQEGKIMNGLRFCAWAQDGLTFAASSMKFIYSFDLDI